MPFTVDTRRIANYKEVCYKKITKEGKYPYADTTYHLAWGSMAIGIGEITQINYKDVYLRHLFMNKLSTISNVMPVTLDDVKKNIGLKTNVANETKSKWLNRISKSMYWELEYNLERKT